MALCHVAASFVVILAGVAPAQPPQEQVDRERLMSFIRELPAKRSAIGSDEHRDGLRRTELLVTDKLKALGLEPRPHEFRWALPVGAPKEGDAPSEPPKTAWNNILIDLPGTDLKNEVILVGAHIDAAQRAPGADDNGTGVSALLELARVLKDQPRRRTVRLAFFNLEEVGLVGSTRYVESLPKADAGGERIVGMVSLEMLGYFSDAPDSQKSPIPRIEGTFEPPTVGDSIAVVGIARDRYFSQRLIAEMGKAEPTLKITAADFLPVPIPDMMRSDHRPFVMAGLPAVMVTDTANFRNPNYHKETDTVETLDPVRYTLVVRAIAGAVNTLADGEGWAPNPEPKPEAPSVPKPASS
ncbi:putative lipoprotein aminopeptidase LpqL [Phycisphaerales bacterium]|nr:putative lipoprotein aminopeptidase LpqL [Phycisphaerales bacterium]